MIPNCAEDVCFRLWTRQREFLDRSPLEGVGDPAEERGRVGEIHLLVSVRVGAGMAWCLIGEHHYCEVQG